MFNIGLIEMIIIGTITLIVVGPERLPDLARRLGNLIRTLRETSTDLKRSFKEELDQTAGTELRDINQLTHEVKRYTPGNKNIEDILESAANSLEHHNGSSKDDQK